MKRTGSSAIAALAFGLTAICPAGAQPTEEPASAFDPVNTAGLPAEPPQGSIVLPPAPQRTAGEPVSDLATALQLTTRLPSLLAEQARERATVSGVDQAQAAFGPSLDGELSYGYVRDRFELPVGSPVRRSGFSTTARAILSQPIYTSGRLTAGVQFAQANQELQRQSRRLAENQALLSSVAAYIGLQRDLALLRIARENYTLLEQQAQSSAERYDKRDLTAVDYDQVRSRLEASRADLASAEASADIARGRFLQAIGAPAGDLAPAPPPLALMPPSLEDAQAAASTDSPLVLAAHARERASRAQVRAAQGSLGPTVVLEGSLTREGQTAYDDEPNQTLLRGAITARLPIYDSGLRYAQIEEARALNDADERLIDQAQRDVRTDVQTSWDRYVAGVQSISSLREAARAAESAYNGAVLQERAGLVTTLDVLILLRDLLLLRSQLVSVEAETQISRYSLLAAMGRLEFDRLNIVAVAPDDSAKIDRVSPLYTLPAGPVVRLLDSPPAGSTTQPPQPRDTAGTVQLPGLPAPDPNSAAGQDTTISVPAAD